jgi:hypothetical protein
MHGISAVNSIKDISTSYLMRADYEKYLNPHTGINLSIDRIKAHDCKDFQRNVKFFKEFYLKKEREASPKNLSPTGKKSIGENDNWSIPLPLGVSISMNSNDLYILKSLIKDGNMNESKELENENQELKLKDYLSKIINILESKNKNDFLHKTRLCFLGNHFRYILGSSSISSDILEVYNKAAKSFSEKLETNCNDHFNCFQDFLDDFVKNCKNHPNSKQDSQTVHTFSSNIYNGFRTAKKLFTFLKKNSNLAKGNDKLYFDIKENINTFLEFAELYFDCNTITHFFDFSWEPYISAGEYAQLNIYSRLFSVKEFHEGKKEFIVFFDEIEITVHPELQLELLSNLIKFFEIFFYGHKVHLFFASHSPVLLSDIPKANVCFIKRDGYDTKIVNPETDNTFGANIHSLYRHSFFMENGTIGTLAAKRINEAIALLINSNDNNSKSSLEDYLKEETKVKQIIDLIGEPIIKEKLTSMYIDKYCNTPGKKIAYLKEQIKELEKLSPQENGNE